MRTGATETRLVCEHFGNSTSDPSKIVGEQIPPSLSAVESQSVTIDDRTDGKSRRSVYDGCPGTGGGQEPSVCCSCWLAFELGTGMPLTVPRELGSLWVLAGIAETIL